MRRDRKRIDPRRGAGIVGQAQHDQAVRGKGYRDQALALFPHVCARCGREFEGARLRELTVHHIDNDHMNNPPDGSNWELLCLYCHDDAHGAYERTKAGGAAAAYADEDADGDNPFAGLRNLIRPTENPPEEDA